MNCVPSFILGTLFLYARGLFIFPKIFLKKSTYPPGISFTLHTPPHPIVSTSILLSSRYFPTIHGSITKTYSSTRVASRPHTYIITYSSCSCQVFFKNFLKIFRWLFKKNIAWIDPRAARVQPYIITYSSCSCQVFLQSFFKKNFFIFINFFQKSLAIRLLV